MHTPSVYLSTPIKRSLDVQPREVCDGGSEKRQFCLLWLELSVLASTLELTRQIAFTSVDGEL